MTDEKHDVITIANNLFAYKSKLKLVVFSDAVLNDENTTLEWLTYNEDFKLKYEISIITDTVDKLSIRSPFGTSLYDSSVLMFELVWYSMKNEDVIDKDFIIHNVMDPTFDTDELIYKVKETDGVSSHDNDVWSKKIDECEKYLIDILPKGLDGSIFMGWADDENELRFFIANIEKVKE